MVTVARMRAGDAFNVIPQNAAIGGTIRYFEDTVRDLVHERVAVLCEGIAGGMGCTARVDFQSGIIPVRNDPALSDRVAEVAAGVVGAENVARGFRTMANDSRALHFPHHHPRFDIDEDALVIGAAVLAGTAASLMMRTP